MKYFFFIFLSLFLLLSSCQSNDNGSIEGHLVFLDSVIHIVEAELLPLEDDIENLSRFSTLLFQSGDSIFFPEKHLEKGKYLTHHNGLFYNPNQDGKSSTVFVSLSSENRSLSIKEVYLTERMDSAFKQIIDKRPMVSQVYFNSANKFSRLYPPYDLLNSLDPSVDPTSFNFYYLGDELRNPTKKPVWVEEVYIDPVGRGWILSLIQPVYHGDELKGVLGLDITISDLMSMFLDELEKKLIIIDSQGTIVAGGAEAIEALSMPPLKNHAYIQTINSDNFRKENFNLFKSKSKEVRRMASKFLLEKENFQSFEMQGKLFKAYSRKMNIMDWYLLDIHD